LPSSPSPARVNHQEVSYQFLGILGHVLPLRLVENVFSAPDLLKQGVLVLVSKGRVPTQKNEDDHANGPHVDCLIVRNILENFRGDVAGGSASIERRKAENKD
jgi:hypothetical protein